MSINSYRSNIQQLTQAKASLEKDLAREREKIAKLQNDISSIRRSITSSTNSSTLQSRQQQINSKETEVAQSQKKIADITSKISARISELNRNLQYLEKAEEQERKKQEAESKKRRDEELRHAKTLEQERKKQEVESKKRRDEELRHAREVTRETERQAAFQRELSNSHFVIDVARLPEKIKVLFVASNPIDQSQLRLDEEIRAITQKIRASEHRDSVDLISIWAVRPLDLIQALNEHKPHIVHFSGHGSEEDELVFQGDGGGTQLVSKMAIVATIKTVADNIRVVLFNACFSEAQAKALTQHIEVAIGMKDAIGDDAARIFAAQFYSAIGFGCSIKQAFDQGISALLMEGIPEHKTPVLFNNDCVEPENLVLVRPPSHLYEAEIFSPLPYLLPHTVL